jgi:hypothetical protein
MLTRTLALSLLAASTAAADVTFFGAAVFPGNATDKSGQQGELPGAFLQILSGLPVRESPGRARARSSLQ